MARKARRPSAAPRLETLELRTLLTAAPSTVVAPWGAPTPLNPASTLLVKFAAGTSTAQVHAETSAIGGQVVSTFPNGPTVVALPPWIDRAGAIQSLAAQPGVTYAEPDGAIKSTAYAVTPNDTLYAEQVGPAQIDAPYAWSVTTGSSSTIVAVLDTGLDTKNAEFTGRVLPGWNFLNNTSYVQDNDGHGTHVTGILAAAGNNAYGVAGVNWNTRILPLKVLDSQGNGSTDAAIAAVYYAVQHGAKVINASWGGDEYSQAMLDALNYANSQNVVFVTAAGNESSNNDAVTTYPASYRTPNELVVAATDASGRLADFSNYGSTVDIAAPGVNVVSTVPGGFQTYSGTSMSTPFVSGTVSLLAGLHPEYSAAQLVALIKATAKPDPYLNGLIATPGVVDAFYAVVNYQPGSSTAGSGVSASGSALLVGGSTFETVESAVLTNGGVYSLFGGTDPAYTYKLYVAIDGRAPSSSELYYQMTALQNGTETRASLVAKLQGSVEAQRTKVARWYQDELQVSRTLDDLKSDPSIATLANLLARGASDADVQAAIFGNPLYFQAAGGTAAGFTNSLFHALLGRDAEPDAIAYIANELFTGSSAADVARQILRTNEGHLTTIANLYRDELGSTETVASLKGDGGVAYFAKYLGAD